MKGFNRGWRDVSKSLAVRTFRPAARRCVIAVFLRLASGCAEEPSSHALDERSDATADEELTDSIVVVQTNGRVSQMTVPVTPARRALDLEASTSTSERLVGLPGAIEATVRGGVGGTALALTTNRDCQNADLWLYDRSLRHRICISGAHLGYNAVEQLDLHNVSFAFRCLAIDINGRCTERPTWAGEVGYVYPGANSGRLYGERHDNPTAVFSKWGQLQAVDPAQSLLVVLLGPYLG